MSDRQSTWARYVSALQGSQSQVQFAGRAFGDVRQQGKVSRWLKGNSPPTNAAEVAAFARALDRNPLEAFVAAGMLKADEAGRGLRPRDRAFLRSLDIIDAEHVDADSWDIAANDETYPIDDEQDEAGRTP